MGLPKKTQRSMFENLQCNLRRLDDPDNLSLVELVRMSEQQERELMTYVMSLPQARFDKVMACIGARWKEYTELKLANRKRMKELAEQGERVNGH